MKRLRRYWLAGPLVLGVSMGPMLGEENWRVIESANGRKLEAKVLSVEGGHAWIKRKSDGKNFEIKLEDLAPRDREFLKNWKPDGDGGETSTGEGGRSDGGGAQPAGPVTKRLYPNTRDEIEVAIGEITDRAPENGVSEEQQKTINELNVYRYLCGVSFDVKATPSLVAKATEAAVACKENGGLSHEIGHYTNKCNLSGQGNIFRTVKGYIEDSGASNRERRGHRRWCLNPPMKETAFGSAGSKYSAMWAMNASGRRAKDSWAYPGKGFFPKERVHGTGWSLFLNGKAPSKNDLKVEVFRLDRRPDRAFGMTEDIPGHPLEVVYVGTNENAINFEPAKTPLNQPGVYWVRVRGGGVREGYLVELY